MRKFVRAGVVACAALVLGCGEAKQADPKPVDSGKPAPEIKRMQAGAAGPSAPKAPAGGAPQAQGASKLN